MFPGAFVGTGLTLFVEANFVHRKVSRRGKARCALPKDASQSTDPHPSVAPTKRSTPRIENHTSLSFAERVASARNRFQQISDEVRTLQSSAEGLVLGSDLSNLYVGKTSLIQDLDIPDAPYYWGVPWAETFLLLKAYLAETEVSTEERIALLETCKDILAKVRGWTLRIADHADVLLTSESQRFDSSETADAVDSLVTLLQTAGFAILPELQELTDPPSPEALSLGNSILETLDPTLLRGSTALRDHISINGVRLGRPSFYPYLFIATRGISLVRKSGLLLPQKIRALERTCFTWIRSPMALLLQPLRTLRDCMERTIYVPEAQKASLLSKARTGSNTLETTPHSEEEGLATESAKGREKKVRRVVPALKLESGWTALTSLFLPTFTQEPSHELMLLMYREVVPNKASIRQAKRAAIFKQVQGSVMQAINPIPSKRREAKIEAKGKEASVLDTFEKPLGEEKRIVMQLLAEVPWGTVSHFFPSTFVLPATRDLLRIDALTFLGLVSAFFAYLRQPDSAFIWASLAGSFISYSIRVGFGWRTALTAYNGRIAKDRAIGVMAKQGSCLHSLAILAADEMAIDVCSVWMAKVLGGGRTPQKTQRDIFRGVSLTKESVAVWEDWLIKEGL